MKDGTVRFNPGVLNPDIVRAAGPIDPDVGVVLFRDGQTALAGLVNFALHLDTIGGTQYAADYPVLRRADPAREARQGFRAALRQRHVRRHQPHRRHEQGPPQDRDDRHDSRPHGGGRPVAGEGDRQAAPGRRTCGDRGARAAVHAGRDRAGEEGHGQDRHVRAVRSSIRSGRTRSWTSSRGARAFRWRCRCSGSATRSRWSACRARSSWTSVLRSRRPVPSRPRW